jgi:hypothetical protein
MSASTIAFPALLASVPLLQETAIPLADGRVFRVAACPAYCSVDAPLSGCNSDSSG